ncbi:hypothetical protein, partial [Thermophilibacter sp.]
SAIGTNANPFAKMIGDIKLNKWGYIVADEDGRREHHQDARRVDRFPPHDEAPPVALTDGASSCLDSGRVVRGRGVGPAGNARPRPAPSLSR